jgi:hypothetical protein
VSNRVAEIEVSREELEMIGLAITGLQLVHRAEVLAIVMQNKSGVFVHLRPGSGAAVARRLAETDWRAIALTAEEHMA